MNLYHVEVGMKDQTDPNSKIIYNSEDLLVWAESSEDAIRNCGRIESEKTGIRCHGMIPLQGVYNVTYPQ